MSAPACSSTAAPMVTDGTAPAAGSKRAREPTATELATQQLLAELFTPGHSRVVARAQEIMGAVPHAAKKAKTEPAAAASASSSNPFVAGMDAAPTAQTANGAASFASTQSPCLDLFYHLARGYSREDTRTALAGAWAADPELALKVLCHARDARKGKGERLVVYHALLWLRAKKPRSYLHNLLTFLRLGYFKDLSNMVELIDLGGATGGAAGAKAAELARPQASKMKKRGKAKARSAPLTAEAQAVRDAELRNARVAAETALSRQRTDGGIGSAQLELRLFAEFLKNDSLKLKKWRQQKKAWAAHQAAVKGAAAAEAEANRPETAPAAASAAAASAPKAASPTAWFDDEDAPVCDEDIADGWEDLGVGEVRAAVEKVSIQEPSAASAAAAPAAASAAVSVSAPVEPPSSCFISLAAKWAPSERGHFSGQAKRLARILFGGEGGRHGCGFSSQAHMQACLKRYRSLLGNLRGHLCLTERLVCAGRWDSVSYSSVPSKCHQLLKAAFTRHSPERYAAYLAGLKKGVGKINVTGLAPHELVGYYLNQRGGAARAEVNETVEAAWKALVDKVKESGTFASAVAIVDVSGSMSGTPMLVAIAMGLLISELSAGPFQGRVLTFHEQPAWHAITGDTLKAKVACLASAPWGGSTNLQSSFDLILDVATRVQAKQSDLPQTLFCFSDMQFDSAMGANWMQTNFQTIEAKFAKAGFKVPGIVFWNVNGSLNKDAPIQCEQAGCALMAGFSAALLDVFLRAPVDPAALAATAIAADPAKPVVSPLHPMAIMNDSVKEYVVIVDDSERD